MLKINSFIKFLPITWTLLAIQNVLLIVLWANRSFASEFLVNVIATNLGLILIVQFFNCLSGSFKALTILLNIILFVLYSSFWGYHFWIGAPLDFLLAYESLDNFKYGETLEMAVELNWILLVRIVLVAVILISLDKLFKIFSRNMVEHRKPRFLFSLIGLTILFISPIKHNEEILTFSDSFVSYNFRGNFNKYEIPEGTAQYPYLNINELHLNTENSTKPHIFLILLESCNASYLESSNEHGIEYMPFMNSLIKKGIYVENFYSNSVFTGKGHFAVLTGTFPSIGQSVFSHYPKLNTKSIPEILQEAGYRTTFFHGYHDLTFGGAMQYYESMKFDLIKQMDEEFVTHEDLPYIWGWGLQDDKFFIKYFNYLDKDIAKNRSINAPAKPYFSVLGTMSHHYDFKSYPKELAYVYPDPKTDAEYFANSIHLEDLYLRTFFAELEKREFLKNSIVILVGDHGFPSQGLDVEYNGNFIYSGYQEDRFRTPLLILQEGVIKPKRIKKAYSQIDIGPTILDLVGIKALNSFAGSSIFDTAAQQHIIQLVQPYDGLYISNIKYPYKYIYQEHTGKELLFNLQQDPKEQNNIIRQLSGSEELILDRLRNHTQTAYLNQRLIEQNRIWPDKQ